MTCVFSVSVGRRLVDVQVSCIRTAHLVGLQYELLKLVGGAFESPLGIWLFPSSSQRSLLGRYQPEPATADFTARKASQHQVRTPHVFSALHSTNK